MPQSHDSSWLKGMLPAQQTCADGCVTVQTQGHNIRTYTEYLLRRAIEYGSTKVDYVRGGEGRLKRLTVEKGLLREAESVQEQIRYLLKCQVRGTDFQAILILMSWVAL
jgi:hypothetical protein